MSLTFLAKSSAYSWKMSLAGQVLCQRIEVNALRLDDVRETEDRRAAGGHRGFQNIPPRNFLHFCRLKRCFFRH